MTLSTCSCAALERDSVELPCRLVGRVVALDEATRSFRLVDASGAVVVMAPGAARVRAGDLVAVVVASGPPWVAARVERLARYVRTVPFPSPGAEFYRLHRDEGGSTRLARLGTRAKILAHLRRELDQQGYLEVDTPQRVLHPALEPQLVAQRAGSHYLITSPEYQLKRLLAGGLERVYFLGHSWRGDERGPLHLGEFCLLEWYESGAGLADLMDQTEALVRGLARALCMSSVQFKGIRADLERQFVRMSVAEAFERFAGIDLRGVVTAEQLASRAAKAGTSSRPGASFDEIFSQLLLERVEPRLGELGAVFLHHYPAPLGALARRDPNDPSVAERVELYVAGVELSNGYAELTDPEEQRARFHADQELRRSRGREVPALDERFIEALREGIPPCAGNALGVDRLAMLLCGAEDVGQVVPFTPEEL